MTPAEQAKLAGLPGLQTVTATTGVGRSTLVNWHKNKPELFATVLDGVQVRQYRSKAVLRVATELWRQRQGTESVPFHKVASITRKTFIEAAERLVALTEGGL